MRNIRYEIDLNISHQSRTTQLSLLTIVFPCETMQDNQNSIAILIKGWIENVNR